jgi:G:T-mismatch repair DNA endonuclease (very short patch repair protein)
LIKTDIKRNCIIENFNVDILVGNKIIECYGDYWHCNPLIYNSEYFNKGLKMTSKVKWEKDNKRVNFLKNKGFDILILWESEIKNNFKSIEKKIDLFLN